MSTPIETNTEQLQEVLQQVYNLPSRSGGSTTPDLVVVVDGISSNSTIFDLDEADLSIESGSVTDTITKMVNGGHANVLVKLTYTYWSKYYMSFVAENVLACIAYDGVDALKIRFGPLFHYGDPDGSMIDLVEIHLGVDGYNNIGTYRNMITVGDVEEPVIPRPFGY